MIIASTRKTRRWSVADAAQDRLAAAAHRLQGEADQQGDQQGLQHLAGGQRGEHRGRDDAEQELGGAAVALGGLGRAGGGDLVVEAEPLTRVQQVADDQADGQGEGRHHDEVAEREPAHLADAGGAAHRADAEHDRAEDHRLDHHLDQRDEGVAERLELDGEVRGDQPDGDAEAHGDDHRDVEVVGPVLACGAYVGAAPAFRPGVPAPPVVTVMVPPAWVRVDSRLVSHIVTRHVTAVTVVFVEFTRGAAQCAPWSGPAAPIVRARPASGPSPGRCSPSRSWWSSSWCSSRSDWRRTTPGATPAPTPAIAAVAVALAVADSPAVRNGLRQPDPSRTLQPYAEDGARRHRR